MKLIDVDALIDVLNSKDLADWLSEQEEYTPASIVEHALETLPTVDAVPVRFAEFHIFYEDCDGWHAKCSSCGSEYYAGDITNWKYCPNCGARMDGEHETD